MKSGECFDIKNGAWVVGNRPFLVLGGVVCRGRVYFIVKSLPKTDIW